MQEVHDVVYLYYMSYLCDRNFQRGLRKKEKSRVFHRKSNVPCLCCDYYITECRCLQYKFESECVHIFESLIQCSKTGLYT